MLLLLTGAIQSGKTRWLQRVVARVQASGTTVSGVLAPGVWERDANGALVKLGIDNLLLPQGETVHFGMRRDVGSASNLGASGMAGEAMQASDAGARAGLSWRIPDEAIAQVNAHLDNLTDQAQASQRQAQELPATGCGTGADSVASKDAPRGSLLVIDELGRLELERGEGLSSALKLLALGPTPAFPVALVVVRAWLMEKACALLEPAWGRPCVIAPDQEGEKLLVDALFSSH